MGDLKQAIKLRKLPSLDNYQSAKLTLYKISILEDDNLAEKLANLQLEEDIKLKYVSWALSDYFKEEPLKRHIHIVVVAPAGELCAKPHSSNVSNLTVTGKAFFRKSSHGGY